MRRGGMNPVLAGSITLVVAALVVFAGFTKSNPFANPFELKAAFKNAGMVKKNAKVRIAGVDVGKVASVERSADGSPGALVTMEISDDGLPIHRDAKIKVRPRIFLEGNYFVDIHPGSPSAPAVDDGATIPVSQTGAPVGIGQVLETFQRDTRESLRTVLDELGRGFEGEGGRGLNGAIKWWPRAFRDTAVVNDATRGVMAHDLSSYIASAGEVAGALDRDPEALKGLVTDFATTADALADQEANLRRGIGLLDDTLIVGRSALGSLNAAFPSLRRLAGELRPAARAAKPALDAMLPLVKQMRGLMSRAELRGLARELRPVVPDLVRLTRGTMALQEQTRALASCQVNQILPVAHDKIEDAAHPAHGPVAQDGIKWLPGIAGESRSFDANGQYIKTLAQTANYAYALGDGRFFFTTAPVQGVNPPKAPGIPPLRPDVPCETQEKPDLRTVPGLPPKAIKINHNSSAARERLPKATAAAVRELRRNLRAAGLDRRFRVSSKPMGSRP